MLKVDSKFNNFIVIKQVSIRVVLLTLGFMLAVFLRIQIGGSNISRSMTASIVFGVCLLLLAVTKFPKIIASPKVFAMGLAGGTLLFLPVAIRQIITPEFHRPMGNFLMWSLVVSFVALAEEAFLRGTLFDAVSSWQNQYVAVIITAIAFAVLHVPLYGWHVVPLDLFVGLLFGELKIATKSFIAPGIAHTLADLASWWLR